MKVLGLSEEYLDSSRNDACQAQQLVTVGEVIDQLDETTLRGHGTRVRDTELIASTCGVVERTNKLVTVKTLNATRYMAEVGDVVVGRITGIDGLKWRVDLQSKQEAQLQLSAVSLPGNVQRRRTQEDALAMRTIFAENDVVSAEIQAVHSDGIVLLHTRSSRYGKLSRGQLVTVPSGLVKRQRQHIVTLDGVEIILGCNGLIWIGCCGEDREESSLASNGGSLDASQHAAVARVAMAIRSLAKANTLVTFNSISNASKVH
jgi:exosome complex component RRP4